MASLFDDPLFNARLFAPRPDTGSRPPNSSEFMLEVAEGVALHARWYPDQRSAATIVVFHGNGEIVADYDVFAGRYHDQVGADLVVVDFRGYGRSGGVPTFRDCIADSTAVIRELRAAMGERLRLPLVALGRSLGGACAAELAAANPPLVDAIVLESAPADPRGIIRRRNLAPPERLSDAERDVFDPRPKLARCQLPVLVLHGAKDRTIPPREARENFDRVSHANKQWSLIRGRGHSDVLTDPAYFLALSRFISAVKGGPFPAPVRGAAGLGLDALLLTWWSRLRRLLRAN